MSIVDVFRFDPGAGEAHHGLSRDVGGTTRKANAHALIHDALNWGGGATGNIMNAVSSDASIGSFLTCDGLTWAVFKVEISAPDVVRRLYAVHRDKHASTQLVAPDPVPYEVAAIGAQNGGGAFATRVSGYYHAGMIRVPVLGAKEVTLMLLDGLSSPTLHIWGCAV